MAHRGDRVRMIKRQMPTKQTGEIDPRFEEDPLTQLRVKGKVRFAPQSKAQVKRFETQETGDDDLYERD